MRTNQQIRYDNLKYLLHCIEQERVAQGLPARGAIKQFGSITGVGAAYTSHLHTGRKALGSATARMVESALRLEVGWLDCGTHSAVTAWLAQSHLTTHASGNRGRPAAQTRPLAHNPFLREKPRKVDISSHVDSQFPVKSA